MKKKALVLLTDCYPVSAGEFFLEDEMRLIAPAFDKVYVLVQEQPRDGFPFFVPDNVEVKTFEKTLTLSDKLKGLLNLRKSFFRKEMKFIFRQYGPKARMAAFKVMFMDLLQAQQIVKALETLYTSSLSETDTYYYSYWHSRNALALALFSGKQGTQARISRAHGWDVFFDRHNPKYLPFKQYITSSLDQTFSISDAGRNEFLKVLGSSFADKVSVARLGKINRRSVVLKKQVEGFLFCSCSNLIPLKRVHLIVELLKSLELENVRWVHFGAGPLMEEIQTLVQREIPHVSVEFKGNRPNAEILDFYAQQYVDLLINFSEHEGIPVSIMEALSAGIPVLATAVGGTPEIVGAGHGFLVEKDFDMQTVATDIRQYLSLPSEAQEQYRQNAYDFWQEHYNAEKNYPLFLEKLLNATQTVRP